ncbi:hypothetical protein H6P81_011632 [Aristolochia fimbriata]|uniref:EF-hand domain-containing protein n=1 Tax=Aristolochia fimbriata TaxID=158543 RepID=A0AAV7E9W0_ARIFI|nr:hypothetical protein H6P81_011632 [Aristolochia fimbriata]
MSSDDDTRGGVSRHERRWASDTLTGKGVVARGLKWNEGEEEEEELVEVTLDFQDDVTVVLRSVEPAAPAPVGAPEAAFPSIKRSSSSRRLRHLFSQELKAEAVARARQFSHELKAELKRFSRSHGCRPATSTSSADPHLDAARALRRQQAQLDRTRSGAQKALKGLRFISAGGRSPAAGGGPDAWNQVEHNFERLAKDGFLHRTDFAQCIGMKDSKEFALELFDALSRRRRLKTEKISREDLHEFWLQITDESFDSRLQIFFDMVDKNEDGRITETEVKEIIMLSASANKLSRLREQAEEYAALIMEELDPERLGYIELWQLETLLLQRDTYLNYSQALSYTSQALSQNLQGLKKKNSFTKLSTKLVYYLQEHWRRLWLLTLWILIVVGLFLWKFFQYKRKAAFQIMGYCLLTAKGAAETLKFNMALVLLPVSRNTITSLRSTSLALFIPFDDNINFHKTIAAAIVIGVILHVGNHLACDFPRLISSQSYQYDLVKDDFGDGKPSYLKLLSGPEGITGIIMVVFMAIAFLLATRWFRRSLIKLPRPLDRLTGFNAFWYSHHIFVLVYVLLVVHGVFLYLVHPWYQKTTWMYLAVPVLLYAWERTLRAFRSGYFAVRLLKMDLLSKTNLTSFSRVTKCHLGTIRFGMWLYILGTS